MARMKDRMIDREETRRLTMMERLDRLAPKEKAFRAEVRSRRPQREPAASFTWPEGGPMTSNEDFTPAML